MSPILHDSYVTSGCHGNVPSNSRNGRIHIHVGSGDHYKISPGGGNGRIHVDIPHSVQRQSRRIRSRSPSYRLIYVDISVPANGAGSAENGDIRGDQISAQRGTGYVSPGADSEILRVDQPVTRRSLSGSCGNGGVIGNFDMRRRGFNETAIPTLRSRGIQGAADLHRAVLHVAHESDSAVMVLDGLRINHAGVIYHPRQELPRRPGGHQYVSPIGQDHSAVLCQRVHRTLVHCHIKQPITGQVQGDGITCSQRHRAQFGRNHPFVADSGAQQRHEATVSVDGSLVENHAAAVPDKRIVARHKITVGDSQGRGDQSPHVDRCTLAEKYPVRVQQEHFTIGRQSAEDAGRIFPHYPVQRHRTAPGLHEPNCFCPADIETLPVDHHVGGGLRDGRAGATTADAAVSCRYYPPHGKRGNVRSVRHHKGDSQS